MADNFDIAARRKALAAEYTKKILKHEQRIKAALTSAQYDFSKNQGANADTSIFAKLETAMLDDGLVVSEYITKHLGWMFGTVIPESERELVLYFADRLSEYPYSDAYNRRSFRAKSNRYYTTKLVNILRGYGSAQMSLADIPLERILNRELPEDALAYFDEYPWVGSKYTDWQVAFALDRGNSGVEEAVTRILTDENHSSRLTNAIIRGVLISHRSDFHTLLCRLLLAARLQEGLRQAICENADCGTKEGFAAILKTIAENDLVRFSSVKRAVGTWLGILTDDTRDLDRISKKSIGLIIECIDNSMLRYEYLSSDDAMELYISLWSYGLTDIDTAVSKVGDISENGSKAQLLVSGYFAANIGFPFTSHELAKTVLKRHHDDSEITAMWLSCFMPISMYYLKKAVKDDISEEYKYWFDDKAELYELYGIIQKLYDGFSGKKKSFSPCAFPWYEATLAKSDLAQLLCLLATLSCENEKRDYACSLIKECDPDLRNQYFSVLLYNPQTPIQRKALLDSLADRESYTRKEAYTIARRLKLSTEEYIYIENHLRFKGADIRKNVMELLMKQNDEALRGCIARLLENGKEEVRLGGLDMLSQLKKDGARSKLADSFNSVLSNHLACDGISEKERLLLQTLCPEIAEEKEESNALFSAADKYLPTELNEEYTELCAQTFAEYFPESLLPSLIRGKKGISGILSKIKSAITEGIACKSSITAARDLISLSQFIEAHKTHSFENSMNETVLLGSVGPAVHFMSKDGKLPLKELWQEWCKINSVTHKRILCAYILNSAYSQSDRFSNACADSIKTVFGAGFEKGKKLPYSTVIDSVLEHLVLSLPKNERTHLASAVAIWFLRCVPNNMVLVQADLEKYRLPRSLEMIHILGHKQLYALFEWLLCENDKLLKHTFPLSVFVAERCIAANEKIRDYDDGDNYSIAMPKRTRMINRLTDYGYPSRSPLISTNAYIFAAYQGIITPNQLYSFLLSPDIMREATETVTSVAASYFENGRQVSSHNRFANMHNSRRLSSFLGKEGELTDEDMKLIRFVADIYGNIVPLILSSELRRGDSPAEYTNAVRGIARIYGAKSFADILSALGNDTLDRTAYYGWGGANDRKSTLSYLLSVCIPDENDSAETLSAALAGKKISKKRLIEAALFSPEWIQIIGKYLEAESFESVCYYFMAHMNERFDDKRKAMIARYTPLSEEELNLGAFDVNWFNSAYSSIGEKEFELIYDAAKYISDGAKHSRARKYADATLGKFDVEETEKTISEKRNKDILMAYALIPIKDENDIFRRYLYIQKFRKESKQFGSQRIASEAKAVEIALTNLAINAGYSDSMRLTLRMETKMIDDSRALLEEQVIDGVTFKITLDENGKATLNSFKDGKPLKSVPAKLKKQENVLALSNMTKSLNEQYRRTRTMLERAMEDGTVFGFDELSALSTHPVVYPMLKNLVLISGNTVGFLAENGLADSNGDITAPEENENVRIAHPFELYENGCWRSYQKYLFENKITQPFRQVFRELYIKTDEESEAFRSLRYAGNQIQPAKTVATLKSRRWVADIEGGLQKVYYKENIVAQIYALADWFSPADIEAPTLEWVCFSNRKTGEEIKISEVPDIIFSEVMRDVDLAVSVAHAGGVDPETSHSTIEMRTAILSFVLPMLRVENVKTENRHAIINGSLAEYSVHLGSGVVHQLGGAMIPVLPVHSQHRGKIFLPFADDDPKTAEIISKILLFADDSKIKDPMILSAIKKSIS